MTVSRWQTVSQIFEAVLDLPANERDSFVRKACAGNAELEWEVNRLLAADGQAGSFLEHPALSTLPALTQLAAPPLLRAGTVVAGRFQIVRFIGQGGMGQVYEALDIELNSRIALKTIRPEIASDPRMLSRFRREVQLTRMITHPNVCRTFDIERHVVASAESAIDASNLTFLTMELLEGETLSTHLRRNGRLTPAETLPLVLQMIDALAAAHAVGVIHRDFKPPNVLLVPSSSAKMTPLSTGEFSNSQSSGSRISSRAPRVVVTDFGLARALAAETQASGSMAAASAATSLTGDQILMGTLVYMAPEQFERGEASIASDIYSLGLVMFEMVTGQRPFADDIPFAEATKRLKQPAPSAATLVPDLDPAMDAVISRCLALEPKDRFGAVRELAEVLLDPTGQSISSVPPKPKLSSHATGATFPSRKILWAVVIVAFVVSLYVLVFRHYLRKQAPIQFAERDWILVTDFNNQTGERLFDRVVRDLEVQSLSQSSYINVVPRLSALEAAKRKGIKDIASIDEKVGREVCLSENYKALLSGNIFKKGSRYTIAMRVEAPGQRKAPIFESETIQSPDELFAGVDRLTVRIRGDLGEPLSRIETNTKPLAQVTTNSLEALQRYSSAMDLYNSREFQRCIGLARDAADRDPDFAMAHLLLARAYEQLANDGQSRIEFSKALAHSDRASERERRFILAAVYASNLQNDRAAQEYQHLLDIYPDDVDALRQFAIATFYAGHPESAVIAQRRALTLSPNDVGLYDYMMELLVRTNQFAEALDIYEKATKRNLDTKGFQFLAAVAAWGNGDLDGAQKLLAASKKDANDYEKIVSTLYSGKLLAFQGRLQEAEGAFKSGLGLSRRPDLGDWAKVFAYQLASTEQARGPAASVSSVRQYADLVRDATTAGTLERAGSLCLGIGDVNCARTFIRRINSEIRLHDDTFSEMESHTLSGKIELALGHVAKAIEEERTALNLQESYEPLLALARACDVAHNWKCSIDAYTRYIEMKGAVLRYDVASDWIIAHHRLALTYAGSGDTTKELENERLFLSFFHAADSDLPSVIDARHNLERLREQTAN